MTGDMPRVGRPTTAEELAEWVRAALHDLLKTVPDDYEPGKFTVVAGDQEFAVIANSEGFPSIRIDHWVLEVDDEKRLTALDFINALHGRSSTAGAHWWLGNGHLWQVGNLSASKFDAEIFTDFLITFISIANDRTPEIRMRLGDRFADQD
jgi:hypothetical protein